MHVHAHEYINAKFTLDPGKLHGRARCRNVRSITMCRQVFISAEGSVAKTDCRPAWHLRAWGGGRMDSGLVFRPP